MIPHVLPHDDGEHFWWFHECKTCLEGDGTTWSPCERETLLPLGPDGWQYDPEADTVSPSIRCLLCETHGFWQNGAWRSC